MDAECFDIGWKPAKMRLFRAISAHIEHWPLVLYKYTVDNFFFLILLRSSIEVEPTRASRPTHKQITG